MLRFLSSSPFLSFAGKARGGARPIIKQLWVSVCRYNTWKADSGHLSRLKAAHELAVRHNVAAALVSVKRLSGSANDGEGRRRSRDLVGEKSRHGAARTKDYEKLSEIAREKKKQLEAAKKRARKPKKPIAPNQGKADGNLPPIGEDLHLLPGLLLLAVLMLISYRQERANVRTYEISWQDFVAEMLMKGEVERLEVYPNRDKVYVCLQPGAMVYGHLAPNHEDGPRYFFSISGLEGFERRLLAEQKTMGISPNDRVPLIYHYDAGLGSDLIGLLPVICLMGLMVWMNRGKTNQIGPAQGREAGGSKATPFTFGKANPTIITRGAASPITFDDVAGMVEAKAEVIEFVSFLKHPSKFTQLGARIPKGALLVGPPGTGKTLLAKAVAGEAGVPFFSMSGSDFVEMFVGVGPSRVRDLFAQARNTSPSIIYIDEIDAVGQSRSASGGFGHNNERENTLNQLLVEMDGFNTTQGTVVLASTNRPDILDKALLRPGRFDRQIELSLPDVKEREEIFKLHVRDLRLAEPQTNQEGLSKRLAAITPGFSGADIANAVNEAALNAARHSHGHVTSEDFDYALDRIVGGQEKKTKVIGPAEKSLVAYMEAGRTVATWFLKYADPVVKVSIVPRSKSVLGFSQRIPLDLKLHSQEQIMDRMCVMLAGRVAEELIFNSRSTGAQRDLENVTKLAYNQVAKWGMSKTIGQICLPVPEKGQLAKRGYSEKLQRAIDNEVKSLVDSAMERTVVLLRAHQAELRKLAETLEQTEAVAYDQLVAILGNPPYHKDSPYRIG